MDPIPNSAKEPAGEASGGSFRVCVLIGAFHPVIGGGETQMKHLCGALVRRGIECTVVTQRRPADVPSTDRVEGASVHRVWPRGKDRTGKYWMMLPALSKLISLRDRYDVLLVSGIRTLGVVGVVAGKLLGKPTVLRMASRHEMSGEYIWGSSRTPKRRLIEPWIRIRNRLMSGADAFLAVSEAVREEYLECGVESEKISSIPNGTDLDRFHPADSTTKAQLRETLELPRDRTLFVYTGKLNQGKGLAMLLRVWRRLTSRNGRLHLILVGGGANQSLSCEPELRRFVREHQLESSVTFTGYRGNVDEYLRAADVFVLPSESEAMPNSLLEAMACGLPCFASAVGGVLDIVEDRRNGRMLRADAEDDWVQAIEEQLGASGGGVALGGAARDDAVSKYDRKINVDRFVDLASRLAISRGNKRAL